jgi:hypothetical protein
MMSEAFLTRISDTLDTIRADGLWKTERPIVSPQGGHISVAPDGRDMLNLCANNYLGLADHPALIAAAKAAMDTTATAWRACASSAARRTCTGHWKRLASFLGKDDTILFAACFDANGGLFEPLLGPEDAVVSDALNHASIIDGIRLCKARRYRYANADMDDLEAQLTAKPAPMARATHHDRHRWRVFHGRLSRPSAGDHRACGTLRRRRHGRRLPRHRASWGRRAAARRTTSAWRTRSRSSPARSARRLAVPSAAISPGRSPSSTSCGSARGPTCSPTRLPPAVCAAGIAAIDLVER